MSEEVAGWLCSHDGYLPSNRAGWCDLGCGNDYNRMVPLNAVVVRHFERLARQLGQAKYGGLQCCDDHEHYSGYCAKCQYFRFYTAVSPVALPARTDTEEAGDDRSAVIRESNVVTLCRHEPVAVITSPQPNVTYVCECKLCGSYAKFDAKADT